MKSAKIDLCGLEKYYRLEYETINNEQLTMNNEQ